MLRPRPTQTHRMCTSDLNNLPLSLSIKLLLIVFILLFFQRTSFAQDKPEPPKAELKVLNAESNGKLSLALEGEGKAEIHLFAKNGDVQDVKVSVKNIRDENDRSFKEVIKVEPNWFDVIKKGEVKPVTIEKGANFKKAGKYKAELLLEAGNLSLSKPMELIVAKDAPVTAPSSTGNKDKAKEIPTFVVVRGKLWGETNTEKEFVLPLVQIKGDAFKTEKPFYEGFIRSSDGFIPPEMGIEFPNSLKRETSEFGKELRVKFKVKGVKKAGVFTTTIHIPTGQLKEPIAVPIKVVVKHHLGWLIAAMVPGLVITSLLTWWYMLSPETSVEIKEPEATEVCEKLQDLIDAGKRRGWLLKRLCKRMRCDEDKKVLILRGLTFKMQMDRFSRLIEEERAAEQTNNPGDAIVYKYERCKKEVEKLAASQPYHRRSVALTTFIGAIMITVMIGLYTLYFNAQDPFGHSAQYLQAGLYGLGASVGTGIVGVLPTVKVFVDNLLKSLQK